MKKIKKILLDINSMLEKNIYLIGSPIFILAFDIFYILTLIIIPFILTLLNAGYFSKISASQMLTYIGSMSTTFCILNLSFITFSFNVNTKQESEKLKNKTLIFSNNKKELKILKHFDTIRLSIPITIKTNNMYGYLHYKVLDISIMDEHNRTFQANKSDYIEVYFEKNKNSFDLNIIISTGHGIDDFKGHVDDIDINKSAHIRLTVKAINEGFETINNLSIKAEIQDTDKTKFKIIEEYIF